MTVLWIHLESWNDQPQDSRRSTPRARQSSLTHARSISMTFRPRYSQLTPRDTARYCETRLIQATLWSCNSKKACVQSPNTKHVGARRESLNAFFEAGRLRPSQEYAVIRHTQYALHRYGVIRDSDPTTQLFLTIRFEGKYSECLSFFLSYVRTSVFNVDRSLPIIRSQSR